jgi:fibronectin-binding autotransporter adhesin
VAISTWSGVVDNDWNTPGNWSAGVPVAGDTARFIVGASPRITTAGTVLPNVTVTDGTIVFQRVGGDFTNSTAIVLNVASSLTIDVAISGTGTIEKTGAGTATLGRANTFTGAVAVTNGTLVTASGALAAIPSITAAVGATLTAVDANASTNVAGAGTITFSGTDISLGGMAVTGSLTFSAATGTVIITSLGGTGTLSAASNLRVNQTLPASRSGNTTVTGILSKYGAATLTLSGANNFGTVDIREGRINAISVDAVKVSLASVVELAAGILDLTDIAEPRRINVYSGATLLRATAFPNVVGVVTGTFGGSTVTPNASQFIVNQAATLSLSSPYSGILTLARGSTVTGAGSAAAANVYLVSAGTGPANVDVILTGTGALTAGDTGAVDVQLRKANTFSGDVLVKAGSTVTGFNATAFGTGTVRGVYTSGPVTSATIDLGGYAVANAIVAPNSTSLSISGGGAYTGTVTVDGDGLATIPSGNSLAGTATVNGGTGTLAIAGAHTGTVNNSGTVVVVASAATTPVATYNGNCGSALTFRGF